MRKGGGMEDGLSDDALRDLLLRTCRIAVVGASARPERASYGVTAFLIARGFDVTSVNPGLAGQMLLGRQVAASLAEAGALDLVEIFRAADAVGPVVDEAIRLGARAVWMQLGIVNHQAAAQARSAGLEVVMDRCPRIEWARLGLAGA